MNPTYETLKFNDSSYPFIIHRGCNNNFLPYWHDSLEIHYIYEGSDNINIDSRQYSVEPLDIVCITPTQTHRHAKKSSHSLSNINCPPWFSQKMRYLFPQQPDTWYLVFILYHNTMLLFNTQLGSFCYHSGTHTS